MSTTTVSTTTTPYVPHKGALRLVGGSSSKEGRLEVFLHGQWGTVCQNKWGKRDARIACRQLGLPSRHAIAYRGNRAPKSPFGPGTGTIWLDQLRCRGTERKLISCHGDTDGRNNCNHSQDVGLRCH
ncbi:macrophage scavenger receptor types I and II-like [Littorina saxatilis]|uniref:macrophage scavenger receptor types I and II-like n=1 Tax=Littorina saxatilis TaxID=31220 RepID=UPI0038B6251E